MVLVDTSIWIDFFRGNDSPENEVLNQLIASGKDIAICGLIRQEVLQGIRDDVMMKRMQKLLDQLTYLKVREPQTFDHAAEIYRNLRRRGKTIRSPGDCLIAALAIEARVSLLHRDKDFLTIASSSALKLFEA